MRRELQSCLKHGRARRTGGDKWEVEYEGLTLVTNDNKKIGVTAYWTGGGRRPAWAESMEVKKREDEQLLRKGSTSVFFPFDLSEPLPPLPESPRGTPRSELGSISHASPRSEPESPRSTAPSRSASREPSHSRGTGGGGGGTGGGTGGGGGSREGGGGWPGTAVAEETMWWRDGAGGAEGELRFRPGLVGAIFLTNQGNEEECLRRGLFGLPNRQAAMVRDIDAAPESTLIFLYNFQHRKMLGAFVAAGRAGFPLHADAWTRADPRPGTRRRKTGRTDFPAQACSRSVAAPACNRSHTSLQPYEQLAPFLYAQLPVAWHGARRGMPQLPLDRFRHLLRYEGTSSRFEQVLDETQVLGK